MRLWTLHPKYLDTARLRDQRAPHSAINAYLHAVYAESVARGYRFDRAKAGRVGTAVTITASTGQLEYEWRHLLAKLRERSPEDYRRLKDLGRPEAHPVFGLVEGPVAPWEVIRTLSTATPPLRPPR